MGVTILAGSLSLCRSRQATITDMVAPSIQSNLMLPSFEPSARVFILGEWLEKSSRLILKSFPSDVVILRRALMFFSGAGGGGGGGCSTFFLGPIFPLNLQYYYYRLPYCLLLNHRLKPESNTQGALLSAGNWARYNNFQMSQKSTLNFVALQKNIQDSLKKPEAKEACLSFEYKLLLLYSSQFGIYIMPQLDSLEVWHGVLFVRYGLYKDAKLKFKMTFEQFPRKPPKVMFVSEVYHPMVDPQSGELDLGEEVNSHWNYGNQHLIFTVVEHIRLIFIDVKKYEATNSRNKRAAELFKNNVDQFFIKVRECVETSKSQVYNNYPNTSLKFLPFNEKHKKIRDHLTQLCEDHSLSQEERKKKLMAALRQ